ncbi:acetyl coenzyme A synthase isoform X2 [Arctopsyche grandis]|uniref:acetyl coenzyme A synthase isoform X2 n=1 Tax=Arctopsyche grandis TaxID=121162 RepID=UPI00406D640E
MSDREVFEPLARGALVPNLASYRRLHARSLEDPDTFWAEEARNLHWKQPPPSGAPLLTYNLDPSRGQVFTRFMPGAITNVCYNALDIHVLRGNGDRVAYFCEGNDPKDVATVTYKELLGLVCRFANVLKKHGIKKGDSVLICMPMVTEAVVGMLACARIGAVHSVVFAGFSADSLAERIYDCRAKIVLTVFAFWRGTKLIELKNIIEDALHKVETKYTYKINKCIVLPHINTVATANGGDPKASWNNARDLWWVDECETVDNFCQVEWMDAEDPLFILYTSGSTGQPKGVVHTTAGYLVYASTTFKYVFDYKPSDVYFCTADVGWITGHTYLVYGPLANCATSVLFSGTPFHPDNDRFWDIIAKYRVSIFYTAPTAIRSLMKFGDEYVKRHDLSSLRILGSVGEPINREAWLWFRSVVGNNKCSIVDTYWQTETGGHIITPLPGATPMKPGSASFPFFGVEPTLLDDNGAIIKGPGEGYLVFKRPWPGIMRTILNNHKRFQETYFAKFPGYFFTGDGARRDQDGYLWITGRVDDMLNVSGHLMSTAQVEGALAEHSAIAEAAVVARPHPIKGESLYCFVTVNKTHRFDNVLAQELKKLVRDKIGAFAAPDEIQNAPNLPKTRSGKIMRRILRKVATGDRDVGDTSTLADENVIEELFANRRP